MAGDFACVDHEYAWQWAEDIFYWFVYRVSKHLHLRLLISKKDDQPGFFVDATFDVHGARDRLLAIVPARDRLNSFDNTGLLPW